MIIESALNKFDDAFKALQVNERVSFIKPYSEYRQLSEISNDTG